MLRVSLASAGTTELRLTIVADVANICGQWTPRARFNSIQGELKSLDHTSPKGRLGDQAGQSRRTDQPEGIFTFYF
jgi:hypothetical protein